MVRRSIIGVIVAVALTAGGCAVLGRGVADGVPAPPDADAGPAPPNADAGPAPPNADAGPAPPDAAKGAGAGGEAARAGGEESAGVGVSEGDGADAAPAAAPVAPRSGLVLIVHGYGNNPSHWPARVIAAMDAYAGERAAPARPVWLAAVERGGADARGGSDAGDDAPPAAAWQLAAYDWEAVVNRPLTAARRGRRIGERLADALLAADDSYHTIHLVAHSLGSHLVQGFIDAYRAAGGGARIHATFLEPFVVRGVLSPSWGVRNFGRGSDFAESYVVRGEPALGTNRYLRRAHNFDLSAIVPPQMREEFVGPHWWVVRYYQGSIGRGIPGFALSPLARESRGGAFRSLAKLQERYRRGETTMLASR